MMARKPRIFTLGHEGLELNHFFSLLESSSVLLVADARENPDSEEFLSFSRPNLSDVLVDRGVAYRRFRQLSGPFPASSRDEQHIALKNDKWRRYASAMNGDDFLKGVEELCGLAASTTTAVLGVARDFRSCPRRLLADRLLYSGLRVVHIFDADSSQEHEYHPDLEIRASEFVYSGRQLSLLS